jgi:hypothetical protein
MGLLTPETAAIVKAVGPNCIWSPVMFESPSIAETIIRALIVPAPGVQKPLTDEVVETEELVNSAPTKMVMFRAGSEGLP